MPEEQPATRVTIDGDNCIIFIGPKAIEIIDTINRFSATSVLIAALEHQRNSAIATINTTYDNIIKQIQSPQFE